MNTVINCPCGSGREYPQCCEPFLLDVQLPPTAETLMRSRFTAYALNNTDYVLKTWDAVVSPDKVALADENIVWQRLEIIDSKKGGTTDTKGLVEFKAFYLKDGDEYVMHEFSRFSNLRGRWLYVDGVVKKVGRVILQNNQGKNAPCSCGSGKKFKRCCGAG